ncbi:MAG: hypothetical protein L3J71_03515 [Victivallaceae bacterium]|nr:hypothetical protein [Victivallaceae bacterium]
MAELVEYGVTSGGAWGFFASATHNDSVEKAETTDENGYTVEQKAISQNQEKKFEATIKVNQTPPASGEILTVGAWTGIIDSADLTETGNEAKKYSVTASCKDGANLVAYVAPA